MNAEQQELFNALCDVVIYHFNDVCHKAGAENSKSAKFLIGQGIFDENGMLDTDKAYQKYEDLVVEYAVDHLPNRFFKQYDFWGAVCISDDKSWGATKSGLYAGDSIGRIMFFDNFASLEAYTEEKLGEL